MKVLSLFDGMACGALALQVAGIEIESYDAFEIDKYAIQTALHNFPFIKQHGDVFDSSFTDFEGVDLVCGGSPCTHWSIAQKNNRETEAKGLGWDLFQQYARAIREAKPNWFIYENNKSMSNAIRDSISDTFGFEPVLINSALVSAQNRQRLYWVGKRKPNGGYSKIKVAQPYDRGILLRDILESGVVDKEKAYCLKHQVGNARDYLKKHHTHVAFESVRIPEYENADKARPLNAYYSNNCGRIEHRLFSDNPNKQQVDVIAEPVCVAQRGRYTDSVNRTVKGNGLIEQFYEAREDGKTNALTTVLKDNNIAEPVILNVPHGFNKGDVKRGKAPCLTANGNWQHNNYACEPIRLGDIGSSSQAHRVYSCDGKSVNITAGGGGRGGKTGLYFCPTEPHGNQMPIYEVRNGYITHNVKQYPIKLADGFYIIRKLTVRECMRLQTVPEWYQFPVSDTQAYKMLGNGWTVDVIAHLLSYIRWTI